MVHKSTKSVPASKGAKRARGSTNAPSKKRKLASGNADSSKSKGKQRAYERPTVPIPDILSDDEGDVSDQDVQFFEENPLAGNFLDELDRKGIARSKKETERLHNLSKPPRIPKNVDDLPSVDSHDEDEGEWSDPLNGSDLNLSDNDDNTDLDDLSSSVPQDSDFNAEQPYERKPRQLQNSRDTVESSFMPRLPIKLGDGSIVKTRGRAIVQSESESEDDRRMYPQEQVQEPIIEDVSTGARFGRPAVANVIGTQSRKARIQMSKEQIAGICQDILAEPESSLGLLRRLHTFSLAQIVTPHSPVPVSNDPLIRRLAMISQLAVFKDVIPGYRIRPLTEAEKGEKVSQMVGRTREWEQGLVSVYQTYLRSLEAELKGKTEFSDLALNSICTLLIEATHFNFRTNLMSAIVARLSKKNWNSSSELCLQTLIKVFRADLTGVPSLEIVRLLNRMIKERKFAVHPNALSCLLHLRLKSELGGVRASETKVDKEGSNMAKWESRGKADRKRAKGKKVERPHMSKKAVKALKEKKEIEGQMQEAEAEVDREEKANMHTETLKLLFVLYFRILKAPHWTPLLPSALQGLSRFAHLVNIDFFKDLMQVLKDLVARAPGSAETLKSDDTDTSSHLPEDQTIQHRLLCIVTAFELLSGQGEALNIDLRDFVNHLYTLILPISLQSDVESVPRDQALTRGNGAPKQQTTADLLFRALSLVFPERAAAGTGSPVRTAAFAKRLLVASLSFPATTTLRSLEFVRSLLVKEPKLQALLSTDDRRVDGIYRPELDDPQLSNPFGASFWELVHLADTHWDSRVREKAHELSQFNGV